jgi:hypothetical protein
MNIKPQDVALLPHVATTQKCPWRFPTTAEEREAAYNGVDIDGRGFSICGYSPDIAGGYGILNDAEPFTTCDYTRADCEKRGMFSGVFGGNK